MVQTSLPRLAIIGGGGAMGRLFARLFVGRVGEMMLFDFFGSEQHQPNLALTLDDVRLGAKTLGLNVNVEGILPVDGSDAWQRSPNVSSGRAIVTLGSTSILRNPNNGPRPESLAALLNESDQPLVSESRVLVLQPADASQVLGRADVILIALRFESSEAFARVIRAYQPWIRPGCLVVDLGSVKLLPMEVLSRELDREIGLLGAHPLFGPGVSNLTGLIVAAVDPVDDRARSVWRGWFLDQLADLRMIVTPTTAAEHDDAMAFVQSLTHFALLSFAYTFVRLDRDPADLLALRTPVFEPLLYLAARVANMARINPDMYGSIQSFTARPDARRAFLESAQAILDAIERGESSEAVDGAGGSLNFLADLFRRYGAPWSPEGKDRRDRQRREHFLDMGAGLVDELNRLRQEIVSAVGNVRGVEERRSGQPPRVVVGVVDLDLLDPGKHDVATRIRLRRLNLALGSVHGGVTEASDESNDDAQHEFVPLARARLLNDRELLDWLFRTGQLVESRTFSLLVPPWFDRDIILRLLTGPNSSLRETPIWDVNLDVVNGESTRPDVVSARLTLFVVVHPGVVYGLRRSIQRDGDGEFRRSLLELDTALAVARRIGDSASNPVERASARRGKDDLKHQRKSHVDRRTRDVDREVRRAVRQLVQRQCDDALFWLLSHGCERSHWPVEATGIDSAPNPTIARRMPRE